MNTEDKYIILEHAIEGYSGTVLASINDKVDKLLPVILAYLSIYADKYQKAPILQRQAVIADYKNVTGSAISVTYDRIQQQLVQSGASIVGVLPPIFEAFDLKFKSIPAFQAGGMVIDGKNLTEWVGGLGDSLKSRLAEKIKVDSKSTLNAARESLNLGKPGLDAITGTSIRYDRQAFELALIEANPQTMPQTLTFIAILDSRTSRICRSLHGKTYPANSPNLPVPPLHPRCRSRLVPYVSPTQVQTYREWLERMQAAGRVDLLKAILGPRYDLFASGKYTPDGMEMATKLNTAEDVADFVKEYAK
ncbi:minor capsid protein [Fundidesulfovibrio putealis]|uniref:minor capsid protein n=1 Tax=Fundidesulfovibrio putealis TaxID=270496 RepID=UPI0004211C4B|nr:minor capsid protein [Fundidesulfovibrio putealis]